MYAGAMAAPPSVRKRVDELRKLLEDANRAYYVEASPVMSDPEFDRLLVELAALEREHPEVDDPDSPTHRVGGEPIEGFHTVRHAVPMLSIDNTYDEAGGREWYAREAKGLELFMNPRNACAGTLKQLDPRVVAQRRLVFFGYGRGEVSPGFATTHTEFLGKIRALGVAINPHAAVCDSADAVLAAIHD